MSSDKPGVTAGLVPAIQVVPAAQRRGCAGHKRVHARLAALCPRMTVERYERDPLYTYNPNTATSADG
jgi:hypothetical protein